jgi:uncharacterized GH25 family protein
MKIRRTSALLALALLALPLAAHDFWIEPASFHPAESERLAVALRVGDFGAGEGVPRSEARLVDFRALGPGGIEKKVAGIDGREPAGLVRLDAEGTWVLGYRSTCAHVELEAAKFEGYLREKGLDGALAERARLGESSKSGRERYSRCAKSIVRAGNGSTAGFDRRFGYTLELTPESDPFALAAADGAVAPLAVRLEYDGAPLADALVIALDLDLPAPKEGEPHQRPIEARTDREGRCSVAMPHAGRWLFSAVHMVRVEGDPKADWESFWASLTLEVPRAAPKD